MFDFYRRSRLSEPVVDQLAWPNALRGGCRALCQTQETVIRSLCIVSFDAETGDSAWSPGDLARRLAEEYGLTAEVRQDGRYLTVRLRRRGATTLSEISDRVR